MLDKDWQYLNDAHRKNSEACLERVTYWSEHPFSREEVIEIFKHQGDNLKTINKKQNKEL